MDLVLNEGLDVPIYDQIYYQISSQIISGQLVAGEQLPSIRAIANTLRISVIPVKMAWERLDKDGFVTATAGRGTFVANISKEKIDKKIASSAKKLAFDTAKKAISLGLSFEELCDYLKTEYNSCQENQNH